MTTDSIKELARQLRLAREPIRHTAAAALEAMAGEVERLKRELSQVPAWRSGMTKRAEAAEAERDRLKDALKKKLSAKARQKLGDLSESMIAMGDGHSLEMLLNWYDESRKALGDAS